MLFGGSNLDAKGVSVDPKKQEVVPVKSRKDLIFALSSHLPPLNLPADRLIVFCFFFCYLVCKLAFAFLPASSCCKIRNAPT